MQLLILIAFTQIFILSHSFLLYFFFIMIENEQLLGKLLGWQKMLDYMYGHKYILVKFLGNALGTCAKCTCFWASAISFIPYCYLCNEAGIELSQSWIGVFFWWWVYLGISAYFSNWFIHKTYLNGM